jgi:hypothetical protein
LGKFDAPEELGPEQKPLKKHERIGSGANFRKRASNQNIVINLVVVQIAKRSNLLRCLAESVRSFV